MKGSRLIPVASFVLIVASPIVYSAAKNGGRQNALTPERATAEYRTEAASLTLAPGWTWPSSPIPTRAPDGNEVRYEKGFGTQAADFYWFCSWASRALDPQLPEAEGQQALKNLPSIRTKYWYTKSLVAVSKPDFDQMMNEAVAGNLSDMRRFYELNCPQSP
ncbi:MAG TPA: hypothetical protein VK464_20035 [Symbiobacteriaceae bacterium]|jgi:hypothetical protein|nr:hypothetical protein [Symbiobacteriaceae bacterium]